MNAVHVMNRVLIYEPPNNENRWFNFHSAFVRIDITLTTE